MIKVLKNADFSALNLGKIDIPHEWSDEAKNVFTKFASLNDSQKDKIGTFVDTLVGAGIYNKINYLMLPMFASSVEEGLQNVLHDGNKPSSSYAEIGSGGLMFTSNNSIDLTAYKVGNFDNNSGSVGVILSKNADMITNAENVALFGSSNPKLYITKTMIQYTLGPSITVSNFIVSHVAVVSYNSSKLNIYDATKASNINSVSHDKTISFDRVRLNGTEPATEGAYNAQFTGSIKALYVGNGLTDAELIVLGKSMENLAL